MNDEHNETAQDFIDIHGDLKKLQKVKKQIMSLRLRFTTHFQRMDVQIHEIHTKSETSVVKVTLITLQDICTTVHSL